MGSARYRQSGSDRDALRTTDGFAAICREYCYQWPGFNIENSGRIEFGTIGAGILPPGPASTLPGGRNLIQWIPYVNGDLFRPTSQFDPGCSCKWGCPASFVWGGFTYNYNASEVWITGTTWGQSLQWNLALRALYSQTFPPNSAVVVTYFGASGKLSDTSGYVLDPPIAVVGAPSTPGQLFLHKIGWPTKAIITIGGAAPVSGFDVNGTFGLQLIDHMLSTPRPAWTTCPLVAGPWANWGYTKTVAGHSIAYVLYVSYEVTYFRMILTVIVDNGITINWSSSVGAAPTATELYVDQPLFKNPPVPSELAIARLVTPV